MKAKLKSVAFYTAVVVGLAVVVFLVANPLAAKYIAAAVGGSIQYGHM